MSPEEYRHESERAHERRRLLKKADDILHEVTAEARAQQHKPTEKLVDAVMLILRAVERLSFADERTLEMRRECGTMIEICTRAVEGELLRHHPAPIIISAEDLPAAIKAGVRDDTEPA